MKIRIELAGIKVRLELRLKETKKYFSDFIVEEKCEGFDIRVEDEDVFRYPLICTGAELTSFSEAYLLMPKVSRFLLDYNCALIHGACFVWNKKSWLITAPSGTGKTTQLRHWIDLYKDKIEIINGDKAVISLKENGQIWLYPSPWTGKEKDAGQASAPLGGIIVLQQDEHNAIEKIDSKASVLLIFQQLLNSGDTIEEIHGMGRITESVIKNIPIWLLKNKGDIDSAKLTHQTLLEYEVQKDETNQT